MSRQEEPSLPTPERSGNTKHVQASLHKSQQVLVQHMHIATSNSVLAEVKYTQDAGMEGCPEAKEFALLLIRSVIGGNCGCEIADLL